MYVGTIFCQVDSSTHAEILQSLEAYLRRNSLHEDCDNSQVIANPAPCKLWLQKHIKQLVHTCTCPDNLKLQVPLATGILCEREVMSASGSLSHNVCLWRDNSSGAPQGAQWTNP